MDSKGIENPDEKLSVCFQDSTNSTSSTTSIPEPDDLNRYVIIERLGNGACGIVMKAYDQVTEKYVAIKIVYQNGSNYEGYLNAIEAFKRET